MSIVAGSPTTRKSRAKTPVKIVLGKKRAKVFVGGYVDGELADRFQKMADDTERGNVTALLEKTMLEKVPAEKPASGVGHLNGKGKKK